VIDGAGKFVKCCLAAALAIGALSSAGCNSDRASRPAVVAYVSIDRKDAEPILAEFTRRTGIEVQAVYDAELAKTTLLVSRIVAESNHPRCDVFWNNENVQTLMLAERELLEPYSPPAAAVLPETLRDAAGHWTAVASRARVIVYNTRLVQKDEAPRTLRELTEPKWRGKVAIANPQFGTTRTHVAALFGAWGDDKAEQFLSDLVANEVRIVDGNAMVKNLVARADPAASPVLVGLTDTDDVVSGQADGEPVDFVVPDPEEGGALVVPSTVCILRKAPHPESARQLVDFLAGGEAGRMLAERNAGYQPLLDANGELVQPVHASLPATDGRQLLEQLERSTEWTAANFRPQ
jgi:iron(III) transport system substrate-binding protein